jgi:hypothetical protein
MCQEFFAAATEPTCCKCPEAYVLPYVYDSLISQPSESPLLLILADLTKDLEAWGLCISLEKLQKMPLFQYLGQVINRCLICPQKVEIRKDNLKTLGDLQKLLGDINWLRHSLSPLFHLLKGDPNPSSLREFTEDT